MKNNIAELQYTDGIDSKAFIEYLIFKNDLKDSTFSILMLETVIKYGTDHHTTSKDELAYFLMDTIPEVDYIEAVAFIRDDLLTKCGKEEKIEFWNNYKNMVLKLMYDKLTPENKKKFIAKYYELLAKQETQET